MGDLAESAMIYTKNQFLRELRRIMDDDECCTLKYQVIKMAHTFKDAVNRLHIEWSDYGNTRLKVMLDDHYKLQIEQEEKETVAMEKILAANNIASSTGIAEGDKQEDGESEMEIIEDRE